MLTLIAFVMAALVAAAGVITLAAGVLTVVSVLQARDARMRQALAVAAGRAAPTWQTGPPPAVARVLARLPDGAECLGEVRQGGFHAPECLDPVPVSALRGWYPVPEKPREAG